MFIEISESRFTELKKMTRFLANRNSVTEKWGTEMECMRTIWTVVCRKTNETLCVLRLHHTGDGVKYFFKEGDNEQVHGATSG